MSNEKAVLASLAAVYLPVMISPGPNFLVVTQVAVDQTRRHAVCTAAGIATGGAILAFLAATGVGLLLSQFSWFSSALQIFGGAYLIYIGTKIWLQAKQPLASRPAAYGGRGYAGLYLYGVMTNLSNPKTLVFFVSIFGSLITPGLPNWVRFAGVSIVCVMSMSWNVMLAYCFSGLRMQQTYRRAKHTINRFTASVLVVFGVKLIWMFLKKSMMT